MARRLQEPSSELSVSRNVHLYDDNGQILGGIYQNGSLTNRRLINMCPHILVFTPPNTPWHIYILNNDGSTGQQLPNDDTTLAAGRYIILGPKADAVPVTVSLNSDSYPRRILSRMRSGALTPRRSYFRAAVRLRDGRCMISGMESPMVSTGDFGAFEAAHIFPHARESDWKRLGFARSITDNSPASRIGASKIHSPQNGILIFGGIHYLFDTFKISVNPDDNYIITSFLPDISYHLDGRTLDFRCRNPQDPNRVSDELLRWHFHTAVIANMRGAALEPSWEMDFPDGDIMGEIMEGPDAAERMEVELFHRLGPGEEAF
ncbi:hypothetical protein PRK78_000858 [Emydomyces testavorans]|uniref:HNH nuclease domain-containing protein n=1 Tax=Emydomyces testavorans TaxID=2070801 RepID=A0AAF0DBE8_9EURO|nr:hypothetical protein PRK78_000858 [Emydomyces testavorans]